VDKSNAQEPTVQQILTLDKPISCLLPVSDFFFYSQENRLYKAGLADDGTVAVLLMMELESGDILSMAADREHAALYLATPTYTCIWRKGITLPILDFGGHLLLAGKILYVYQPEQRRAFQADLPKLFESLTGNQ
jgi:hypothetical protein